MRVIPGELPRDRIENMSDDAISVETALDDAAWGSRPGMWPLPSSRMPESRWARAVALGGQGRYSLAAAELDGIERAGGAGLELRSLFLSTRASWLRQTGGHDGAGRLDGLAFALVGGDARLRSHRGVESACDALTGLGADALGRGRLASADAVLSRCEGVLAAHADAGLWRQRLRLRWVRAELAMAAGDGATAVRHALDARELATETDSLRHRTKTDLILAAARCVDGNVADSVALARNTLDTCSEHGLVPLQWASAMLLNGLGEVTTATPVIQESAAVLRRRGGAVVAS